MSERKPASAIDRAIHWFAECAAQGDWERAGKWAASAQGFAAIQLVHQLGGLPPEDIDPSDEPLRTPRPEMGHRGQPREEQS